MREGEFSEFVFDEELFPLEGVIPEFNLETGWESEMVKWLDRKLVEEGFYLEVVVS